MAFPSNFQIILLSLAGFVVFSVVRLHDPAVWRHDSSPTAVYSGSTPVVKK